MANLPYSRLQLRRGTKDWWNANKDIILYDGEPAVETTTSSSGKTKSRMKIGDGKTRWVDLPYMSGSGGGGTGGSPTCTIKTNKPSVVSHGTILGDIQFSGTIPVDFETVKLNGKIINGDSSFKFNDETGAWSYNDNDDIPITGDRTYRLEVTGDYACNSSVTIRPGYYVYYWSEELGYDSGADSITVTNTINKTNKASNGKLFTSKNGIEVITPGAQTNETLHIAMPTKWGDAVFECNGFTSTAKGSSIAVSGEDNESIDYTIYAVGDPGLVSGIKVTIK